MKKIFASLVLALIALSGVSAKKSIKDRIYQEKIGRFNEVDIDNGMFRLKKTFGTELIPTEWTVKLYSEDGSAGIYYKTDLASKESLRFDKDARDVLRAAYEQYLSDYEAKKLKKSKKFVEAYGVARAKIVWGMISDRAIAHPKIYFGYIFVGKSPYFCIKTVSTNAEEKKGDIVVQYIGNLFYFTRAQAKQFLDAMSETQIENARASTVVVLSEDSDYEEADLDYVEENKVEIAEPNSAQKEDYKEVE